MAWAGRSATYPHGSGADVQICGKAIAHFRMEVGILIELEGVRSWTPPLHRVATRLLVLAAVVVIMLARTSPALAADHGHGQGKARDHTSASAVAQRPDGSSARPGQHVGGSGGDGSGGGGGRKRKGADTTATTHLGSCR